MVAKMLTAGVVIAVANLVPMASSTAHAGYSPWSGHGGYGQRVQFRPWSHRGRQAPTPRWRPQAATTSRMARSLDRLGSPLISAAKAGGPAVGAYAAVPSARRDGSSVVNRVHFRPSGRPASPGRDPAAQGFASAPRSQFRPAPQRRRPTYEQLMAAKSRNPVSFPRYPAGLSVPARDLYAASWGGR